MKNFFKYLRKRKRLKLEKELSVIERRIISADEYASSLARYLTAILTRASTSDNCYLYTARYISRRYLRAYETLVSLRKRKLNINAELSCFSEDQNTDEKRPPKLKIVSQK